VGGSSPFKELLQRQQQPARSRPWLPEASAAADPKNGGAQRQQRQQRRQQQQQQQQQQHGHAAAGRQRGVGLHAAIGRCSGGAELAALLQLHPDSLGPAHVRAALAHAALLGGQQQGQGARDGQQLPPPLLLQLGQQLAPGLSLSQAASCLWSLASLLEQPRVGRARGAGGSSSGWEGGAERLVLVLSARLEVLLGAAAGERGREPAQRQGRRAGLVAALRALAALQRQRPVPRALLPPRLGPVLLQHLLAEAAGMSAAQRATCCWALGVLQPPGADAAVVQLLQQEGEQQEEQQQRGRCPELAVQSPAQLAAAAVALAKLLRPLPAGLLQAARQQLPCFCALEAADLLWALAAAPQQGQQEQRQQEQQASDSSGAGSQRARGRRRQGHKAAAAATPATGGALHRQPEGAGLQQEQWPGGRAAAFAGELLQHLLDGQQHRAAPLLLDLPPGCLANVLWAAASLRLQLPHQQRQQLVELLLPATQAAGAPDPAAAAADPAAAAVALAAQLQPHQLATATWALGALGCPVRGGGRQAQLLATLRTALPSLQPSEVAAAWAGLALLRKAGSTLHKARLQPLAFACLCHLAAPAASGGGGGSGGVALQPRDVATLLWAMASCGLRPRPRRMALLPLLDWAAGGSPGAAGGSPPAAGGGADQRQGPRHTQQQQGQQQQQQQQQRAPLHAFTARQLASAMWALARMGAPVPEHAPFLRALWPACAALLPHMSPRELGNVAWAAGQLGLAPPPAWAAAVAARWEEQGASCLAADNVQLRAALARWQQLPG
jgi:hypothetical protein